MAEAVSGELADVLAYLEKRRANAAVVAKRQPELEPWAEDRRRQLEVVIDELKAGLHVGSADVAAMLADGGNDGA
jgi:hypothetical protein